MTSLSLNNVGPAVDGNNGDEPESLISDDTRDERESTAPPRRGANPRLEM